MKLMKDENEFDINEEEENVSGLILNADDVVGDRDEDESLSDIDLILASSEFSSLNSTMDLLQAELEKLENKNETLHEELLELMKSNREIRQSIVQSIKESANNDKTEVCSETTILTSISNLDIDDSEEVIKSEISNTSNSQI